MDAEHPIRCTSTRRQPHGCTGFLPKSLVGIQEQITAVTFWLLLPYVPYIYHKSTFRI